LNSRVNFRLSMTHLQLHQNTLTRCLRNRVQATLGIALLGSIRCIASPAKPGLPCCAGVAFHAKLVVGTMASKRWRKPVKARSMPRTHTGTRIGLGRGSLVQVTPKSIRRSADSASARALHRRIRRACGSEWDPNKKAEP
jgi:hypothetical protein